MGLLIDSLEGAEKRDEKYTELLEKFLSNYSLEKALIIKQKKTFFDFILAFFNNLTTSITSLSIFSGNKCFAIIVGIAIKKYKGCRACNSGKD